MRRSGMGGFGRGHLSMRSGNPALSADTFTRVPGMPGVGGEAMTVGGTVNKTAMSLVVLFIAAIYAWGRATQGDLPTWWLIGAGIGGFVMAMVTVFKPIWAPYTTPAYAALQGVFLGAISYQVEQLYPGIAAQAVFLTFGVLGSLLFAYQSGIIRATENFKLGVFAATAGIGVVYLLSFVLGFFGMSVPLIHSSGTFGILFSLFVVGIASLNLVLDFDFIEQGAEHGAPKYMEWYGAFGLLVTLVWLYLSILRLLMKLNSRD